MRKLAFAGAVALATFAVASEAAAWGLHAGDGVGRGDKFAYGEAGWPGLNFGFAYGLQDKLEIGGRLEMNYGLEGTTTTYFGMVIAGTLRYTVLRSDSLALEVHTYPGFRFDAFDPTFFGFQIPIGTELGIKVTKEAIVSVGFDLPMFIDFTNGGYFAIAPQAGPGFEYHIDEHMTLGVVTRFGGAVLAGVGRGAGLGSDFAFRTQGFFGYRW